MLKLLIRSDMNLGMQAATFIICIVLRHLTSQAQLNI